MCQHIPSLCIGMNAYLIHAEHIIYIYTHTYTCMYVCIRTCA